MGQMMLFVMVRLCIIRKSKLNNYSKLIKDIVKTVCNFVSGQWHLTFNSIFFFFKWEENLRVCGSCLGNI